MGLIAADWMEEGMVTSYRRPNGKHHRFSDLEYESFSF